MKNCKTSRIYIAIALLAATVLLTAVSVTWAAYVKQEKYKENQAKMENYYFTADLLGSSDETERTVDIYGSSEIHFSVLNYFDDLRINADDIKYTVKYTADWAVNEGDVLLKYGESTVGEAPTEHSETLTAAGGKKQHTYKFEIADTAEYEDGDEIVVTVKSEKTDKSAYSKTMVLKFKLHKYTEDISYRIEDDFVSTKLVIMSNVEVAAGKLVIDWSAINSEANILQVDCNNAFLLEKDENGALALITNLPSNLNTPAEEGGVAADYLKNCIITQKIDAMQSLEIIFFKVPTDGKPFYCTGNTAVNAFLKLDSENGFEYFKVEAGADGKYQISLAQKTAEGGAGQ